VNTVFVGRRAALEDGQLLRALVRCLRASIVLLNSSGFTLSGVDPELFSLEAVVVATLWSRVTLRHEKTFQESSLGAVMSYSKSS